MMRTILALVLSCLALAACGIDGEPLTPPAKSATN